MSQPKPPPFEDWEDPDIDEETGELEPEWSDLPPWLLAMVGSELDDMEFGSE